LTVIARKAFVVIRACAVMLGGAAALAAGAAVAEWGTLRGKFVYDGDPPEPKRIEVTKDKEVCEKEPLYEETLVVASDGSLANVIIFVVTEDVEVHEDYAATAEDLVRFDNIKCRFEPRVMGIRLSQKLELHNSDPGISHNTNVSPLGDRAINPAIAPEGSVEYQFSREQAVPVMIKCDFHPWMRGYILPRKNPYVAVSQEDGTFEIKNLPAGKLRFIIWHESGWLVGRPETVDGATRLVIPELKDRKKERKRKNAEFDLEIMEGENDLGEIRVGPEWFATADVPVAGG
jgi:hypothetical protein